MKFAENWKRFWTLNRHHAAGFTLVELIVVIAILAILAGVAVPAYSGYVTQANMTADQSLVSEVADALTLYYYSNPNAGPLVVVLNPDGTPSEAQGESAKAMEAVFGANWATSVGLKYDGWSGAANMAAVNTSNYMQNGTIADKMQAVTNLAGKATEFVNDRDPASTNTYNKLKLYLGEDFETFCNENGIATENGAFANASSEQLTNLMGLYVANDLSKVDQETYQAILFETMQGKGDCVNSELVKNSTVSSTTYLAIQYAMISSIAAADEVPGGADRLTAVDTALENPANMAAVQSAINSFFFANGMPTPENPQPNSADLSFIQSVQSGYSTYFPDDVKAITSVMNVASSQAKNYYNDASDLDTGDFFNSPSVEAGLNSYVHAATQLGNFTNVSENAVILYTDGVTADVVVTPAGAYLAE